MNKKIAVVSGKGGVGKTLFSINLAMTLQKIGKNTTLLDGDIKNTVLCSYLGVSKINNSLQSVISNKSNIKEALYVHKTGLKFIPSDSSLEMMNVSISENLDFFSEQLENMNGIVLIDTPPGICSDTMSIIDSVNEIIIVANPRPSSVINAAKVSKICEDMGKNVLGIAVNRIGNKKYDVDIEEIEIICKSPTIAKIIESNEIEESIINESPLVNIFPKSKISQEFYRLARSLT